jgi:hypothetical protein
MPFANKHIKGCSISLELLYQAKNLLARNLTMSSPCTLLMCTPASGPDGEQHWQIFALSLM